MQHPIFAVRTDQYRPAVETVQEQPVWCSEGYVRSARALTGIDHGSMLPQIQRRTAIKANELGDLARSTSFDWAGRRRDTEQQAVQLAFGKGKPFR